MAAARSFSRAAMAPLLRQQPLQQRSFQTSAARLNGAVVSPRKPIGAFRGSLFGFLLGTVLAGSGLYYYVVDEYKISNRLLVEDIYALQSAVTRLEGYTKSLEESIQSKK